MRSGVIVLGFITGLGGLAASGGCGFSSPPSGASDDGPGMGACVTFASQVDTCTLTFGGDLTLSGSLTYDTGTHELQVDRVMMPVAYMTLTAKAGNVDAIIAHNVRITSGAGLYATGPLPFAIIASGSITLDEAASIDVGHGGAGAQASCANPPMRGVDSIGGGAGGGGGGYGAAGGKGGDGNANSIHSTGGIGQAAIAMPAGPRGGCPGARGGAGDGPAGGVGGSGGGALYLVAADRIELGNMAALTAGGGGGHGGGQSGTSGDAGGGGGGSGGMIFFEAAHVIGAPQSRAAANGGGGGEGSEVSAGGRDGDNGTTSTNRAGGGNGGSPAGADGGLGGSRENPVGETVTMLLDGGGGGGGGSVGFVHIVSPDIQLGSVSPAAN